MSEMNGQKPKRSLGARLLEQGLITEKQLEQALDYQKDHDILLGEALAALGFLSPGQLAAFINQDKSAPIGEILIQKGFLNREKLNAVLEHQRIHGGRLGAI